MANAFFSVPKANNEPVFDYAKGDLARDELQARLKTLRAEQPEIPLIIGGKEVTTGEFAEAREPHNHGSVLAKCHQADAKHIQQAIEAADKAKRDWERMPWEARASVFLKAAELISTKYRATMNAATMLNQSKSAFQAEIDSACELIDFLRFNAEYMQTIYEEQPALNSKGIWNRLEHRPLEGYVAAITPFNFTAIAGNLPTAPAMMGNTILWKPASTQLFSAWQFMKILQEAGLPDGVINFVPGSSRKIGAPLINSKEFAGVHFTGSTGVFRNIWKNIGENIANYKVYPRIVGETGGKDFVFAHASADVKALATALIRGAFEYQGQKCSAASRAYVPKSIWGDVFIEMQKQMANIKLGPVDDFSCFMNAVIDKSSFDKIKGYIERAQNSGSTKVVHGGECNDSEGYFIQPTVIETTDPQYESMVEEIFGPVLTVYPYDENKYAETLAVCDGTSDYALTGAVFANDRQAVNTAFEALRHAAGNFYINDKPTGAVVGQQPFGGARASGTNDKAGSALNLLRWTSPRTIKETFVPPVDFRYPFMQ